MHKVDPKALNQEFDRIEAAMGIDPTEVLVLDVSKALLSSTQNVTYFNDGRPPDVGPVEIEIHDGD